MRARPGRLCPRRPTAPLARTTETRRAALFPALRDLPGNCPPSHPAGGLDGGEPTFAEGSDAIVLGKTSRAARDWKRTLSVSKRWREISNAVGPWKVLRELDNKQDLNWSLLEKVPDDPGAAVWQASSTSREEGKKDKWHTVRAPGGDRTVVLVRQCNEEGVSYDIVRWMGCLQGMHHPCIASLQLARASHDPDVEEHTRVHAGFEWVDTSVQKIVYGTLERTSHTVIGRALPDVMLRSFLYQMLSALACCHARGIAHGNLAPYRVLARTLDAERDQYLLKLGDFGFSPPSAALCNEELPIRPSRASPELHADHKHKRYGPANDIWALGTVFAEMACGNRDPTVYMMIQELDVTDEATLEANLPMLGAPARDLLRKMLKHEPMDRIAAADALCHPYFDGLHDQCEVVAQYLPLSAPAPTPFLELNAPAQWDIGGDFLQGQPELNARMWTILFDWLAVVSHKFKFVPRSLQLATDFMLRYMTAVRVQRRSLQLVGIGALCLACKHEEVMIPNMNDFIFICDNAYSLAELMSMEVDILTTLQVQLHMATAHDLLRRCWSTTARRPRTPTSTRYSDLRDWCECLTLVGQAHLPGRALRPGDARALRRHARRAALTRRALERYAARRHDAGGQGDRQDLCERVCWLKPGADWECMRELIGGLEAAVKDSREMLVKCHPQVCDARARSARSSTPTRTARRGRRPPTSSRSWCARCSTRTMTRRAASSSRRSTTRRATSPTRRRVTSRSGTAGDEKTSKDFFSVAGVTAALGRQLLAEHAKMTAAA